jgi:hypothetical protein
MGRFFQTAPTQFVDNYIYQPPWELMQQAASQKQKIYDAAIASTKLFDNIPIEHLQGEDDVYNVQEKQRYYAENAANIAKAIQNDPSKAQQYLNNIDSLQKELQKDMTSGDLSHIVGSAQAFKKWQEDNKKLKEDDPSRYTAAERAYLGEYLNAGGNSISQGFRGEQVTKGIDYDAIRKSLGELKANKIKSTRQTPGGGLYMVETENGLEEMSEERMNGWMLSQILSPENLASLSQSEKFGLGTYRNSEGKIDYDNGSLFAPLRGFARAGHYSQQENSFKVSTNTAAVAEMNEAGTNRRWAIDRQDKLNKEYQDRVDAANKTKDEKVSAIDKEIADGWINNDMVKVQFYENAKNNLLGREGTYKSNMGSMFKDFKDLQTKSASGNIDAQKQLSQGLNTFLRNSGIDFKDPRQKALAQDIVGKVKQNKLSIDDIEDYLDKKIPIQINRTVDLNTQKFLKNRSVIAANNEKKQNLNLIETKRNQIEQNKALGNNVSAKNRIQKLESEIKDLQNRNNKINPDLIYKESVEDYKKNYRGYKDSNENFRDTFGKRIKGVLEDFSKDWEENKSKFTTNYATAPLSISGQSSMKTILRDVNNRKDFVNEDGTEVSATQFNNFDNITSIVPTDGRGRYGLIATDKNGKQTRLLTNPGTPIYNAIYNIAKGDVNSNTEVGLAVIYPTVGIIKQRAEALKTAGQSNVKLTIKSAKGNTYYLHQVGNTDKFNVYDSFGNLQTKKGPIDYTQAGVGIDKNDNR